MAVDMSQNRVPYGLLTDEEKATLFNHKGEFMSWSAGHWVNSGKTSFYANVTYRPLSVEKTQDEIAWDRLPDWAEWVVRYDGGYVLAYLKEPEIGAGGWYAGSEARRIDDFPGIIIKRGTCDWKDSKQRRPK